MALLITKFGYLKDNKTRSRGGYAKYIATREGAESPGVEGYMAYMATRPRVEKQGTHGLFTSVGEPVVLAQVAGELDSHRGPVWTLIVSLRREDAQRLGYDSAARWRDLCIFRPSESKETVGVSPPSREKQVQVHGRESTGVLFGKKWQRNASQSAPPRVIYSDWNPFLLRMESSPSMRIL